MLFFQVGLLCGYGYAHLLATRVPLARQPWVHLTLVLVSIFMLPITPEQTGLATADQVPLLDILVLLATSIGFPFVILSASAPLLQHWFANIHPDKSPFRLYALSNLGSLVALLSYPFVVEPALALKTQTTAWSFIYLLYAGLAFWCAWPILTKQLVATSKVVNIENPAVTWPERLTWIALAACGSTVLLATTNQMSQDVAVIPFLWVLPLSLYLVTFIICFGNERWYNRPVWVTVLILSLIAVVSLLLKDYVADNMSLAYQIGIYTSAMFACCMVCHGEMVRRRPAVEQLTGFYLYVALGGALGGVFVNIIAPFVFDGFWELHLGLLATTLLLGWSIVRDGNAFPTISRRLSFGVFWLTGIVALGYYLNAHVIHQLGGSIANTRGFYGVLHVYDENTDSREHSRSLYHGRIRHGSQWLSERDRHRPSTYFGTYSGGGFAINRHPRRRTSPVQNMKVGIVGLGIGTIAAYGKPNDDYRFYEINPQVEELARSHFSYLEDGTAHTRVVIGDARISLTRELESSGSQQFDVLIVDAFSGDAIPIHLLTREAVDLYWKHLKKDGILALHLTNFHVNLLGVARQLADYSGRKALYIEDEGDNYYETSNDWVLITNNEKFLKDQRIRSATTDWPSTVRPALWTDDFSNLFEAIDWDW